ncbi:kelch-like protein 24 [Antedon mediterranea]|uniref:kelch-like protein 24 n=1 Tax=Antedon mediterranea TaxID=105859 RepID=UPI003AF45792
MAAVQDGIEKQEKRDSCDYQNYAFPENLQTAFCEMRQNEDMIDVSLCVGDHEFRCHRTILAAGSPYFRAMFTNNLRENSETKIVLQDVNPVMLELIINYIYTSKIIITTLNVRELLATANFFLFKSLLAACSDFLVRQLDLTNCFELHEFADLHGCVDLKMSAEKFILQNFVKFRNDEQFLNISPVQMKEFIGSEDVQVQNEKELFDIVSDWILHDRENRVQYLPQILYLIRLPVLPLKTLYEIQTDDLVQNTDCQEIVAKAIEGASGLQQVKHPWRRPRRSSDYTEVMVVLGGVQMANLKQRNNISSFCCDPTVTLDLPWKKLSMMPFSLKSVVMYDAVVYYNDIYITGGYDGNRTNPVPSVWRYDTQKDTWDTAPPLVLARYQHCSAVVAGKMYVVGGFDKNSKLNSVEYFSVETNKWQLCPPMKEAVAFPAVCGYKRRLFVIGGLKQDDCVYDKIQCFDVDTKKWTVISTLTVKSKACKSVVLNEMIYIVGGSSTVVQVYDPGQDKAFEVAPLLSRHICTSCTVIDGKIYVAGGDNMTDSENWDVIECFDPASGWWTVAGKLPFSMCWHSSLTVIKEKGPFINLNEVFISKGPSMLFKTVYSGIEGRQITFDPR